MAKYMPRKRTILGGVLAAGLVGGLYLGTKLPHLGSGFGLGQGGDDLLGQPEITDVSVRADVSGKRVPDEVSNEKAVDPTSTESASKPRQTDIEPQDDLLTILVDDRHYSVWKKTRKGNGYYPAELNELLELAEKAKPNDDGIRIRIVRNKSARVTAWQALQAELVKAGIPAEAVVNQKGWVD